LFLSAGVLFARRLSMLQPFDVLAAVRRGADGHRRAGLHAVNAHHDLAMLSAMYKVLGSGCCTHDRLGQLPCAVTTPCSTRSVSAPGEYELRTITDNIRRWSRSSTATSVPLVNRKLRAVARREAEQMSGAPRSSLRRGQVRGAATECERRARRPDLAGDHHIAGVTRRPGALFNIITCPRSARWLCQRRLHPEQRHHDVVEPKAVRSFLRTDELTMLPNRALPGRVGRIAGAASISPVRGDFVELDRFKSSRHARSRGGDHLLQAWPSA